MNCEHQTAYIPCSPMLCLKYYCIFVCNVAGQLAQCVKQKCYMLVSSSFTHRAINSSWASPKPLADQLGYWIAMHLSFKPNVACRPTRNLWFVNVFLTFRRQNSMVKNGSWSGAMVQPAQWLIRHWLWHALHSINDCLQTNWQVVT